MNKLKLKQLVFLLLSFTLILSCGQDEAIEECEAIDIVVNASFIKQTQKCKDVISDEDLSFGMTVAIEIDVKCESICGNQGIKYRQTEALKTKDGLHFPITEFSGSQFINCNEKIQFTHSTTALKNNQGPIEFEVGDTLHLSISNLILCPNSLSECRGGIEYLSPWIYSFDHILTPDDFDCE